MSTETDWRKNLPKEPTTAWERQNIKRRYGCDWQTYMRSVIEQSGECAMCGQIPKTRLIVDPLKRPINTTSFLDMVCLNCLHVITNCARPQTEGHGRLLNYLGLVDK